MQPHEDNSAAVARDHLPAQGEELVIPLYVEDIAVSHLKVEKAVVHVATVTRSREHLVDENLTHERVEVERMPIGRYVEAIPSVREEGDLTIVPVVDEIVVVERKLLLREEVHIRRVRTTEYHVETVRLREQDAVVTRIPIGEQRALMPFSQPTAPNLETE